MQFMVGGNIKTEDIYVNVSTTLGEPIPVVQVRPELKKEEAISLFVAQVGIIFLKAWLVMLIIPVVTPWEFGYWQSMLLIIGSALLIKSPQRMLHKLTSLKGK